jgi:hypothetical protein
MRRSFVARVEIPPLGDRQDTEFQDFFKDGSVFAFN